MTYGQNVAAYLSQLYLRAGETVKYDWENNPPGIMQVGFAVYKGGSRVSKELLAVGRVGENFGFYTAPTSGYYYLGALCEGGNDRRCQGGGTIRKW